MNINPCPFCGQPPNTIGVSKIWVQCVKPGCPIAGHNFMLAAWNERPQPSAPVQPLTERELAPWPSYKLLFSVVERGDIEAMAEVNPGIANLLTHFKDGISSHNELLAKLSASPSAQPQPEEAVIAQGPKKENGAVSVQRVEIHKMSDGTYITMTPSGYGENILGEVPPDEAWINWLFERELEDIIADHALKSAPEPSVAAEAAKDAAQDILLTLAPTQLAMRAVREKPDEVVAEWTAIILKHLPAHPGIVPGWVKCSERMPPEGQWLIMYLGNSKYAPGSSAYRVGIAFTSRETGQIEWCSDAAIVEHDYKVPPEWVTEWMPLQTVKPAAPKGQP